MILLLGLVLAGSLGGFALANRGSAATLKPSAAWGMFTDTTWEKIKGRVASRGFRPASVRVISAAGGQQDRDTGFSMLAASRPSGATCFIAVRRTTLGASICRLTKPVTVFAMSDTFTELTSNGRKHSVVTTILVGLARPDVSGVAVSFMSFGRPWLQGQALLPASGGIHTFAGGYRGASATLVAFGVGGQALDRLALHR